MIDNDWKEIMDDILELEESVVVIIGWCDIVISETGYTFKNLNKDSYYRIIGRGSDEDIIECLEDYAFDEEDGVSTDGEYEFKVIMKLYRGDYETGEPGYFDITHIELKLIQTILERERNEKLDNLLGDELSIFDL
jgi:hypothetical protein